MISWGCKVVLLRAFVSYTQTLSAWSQEWSAAWNEISLKAAFLQPTHLDGEMDVIQDRSFITGSSPTPRLHHDPLHFELVIRLVAGCVLNFRQGGGAWISASRMGGRGSTANQTPASKSFCMVLSLKILT